MKCFTNTPLALMLCALLFSGCASFEMTHYSGDFVRPLDVKALDAVSYRHTMISGMVYRNSSQELVMKDLSQKVLMQELNARGYEPVSGGADFYAVSKWRKEINPSAAEAVRFSLIVELYESATDKVFWRAELPYIFNAMQWSEERVSQTMRMAIEDFPSRLESAPNPPSVQ